MRSKKTKDATFTAEQTFPKEKILRVTLRDKDHNALRVSDPDAMFMSQEFPNESFITVYSNGIPTTLTVKQLLADTLLQVLGKVDV